jgi:hypothetical protein
MANPEDMLELRLDHAATPERVAQATRLLADLLSPLLDEAGVDSDPRDPTSRNSPGITVVVSNRELRATVRILDRTLRPKIEALDAFLLDPTREVLAGESIPEISPRAAKALIHYAREEARFHPSFWRVEEDPRLLRVLDEKFADAVEKSIRMPSAKRSRVVGATFITSKVYKVGRRDDGSPTRARVLLPGGAMKELVVAESARAAVSAAYESGREHRIKLVGDWVTREGSLELEVDSKMRIIGIDEQVSPGSTADLLAATAEQPALRKHELAGVLRQLRGGDDEDA